MKAEHFMVTDIESIRESAPLLEAVERLRRRELKTGKVDVRCLIVEGEDGSPKHVITEADVIKAILPWFFRERKFSDFIAKWLSREIPIAALDELYRDLAASARKKTVKDVIADTPLVSVDPEDSLLKVAYEMHIERVKSLPVIKDGKVIGIVFRGAVFEAIADSILRCKGGPRPAPAEQGGDT